MSLPHSHHIPEAYLPCLLSNLPGQMVKVTSLSSHLSITSSELAKFYYQDYYYYYCGSKLLGTYVMLILSFSIMHLQAIFAAWCSGLKKLFSIDLV